MFFVYILYSSLIKKFYLGNTNDLDDRLYRHNSGQENFTSKGLPWQLIWYKEVDTRKEAVRLEIKIKKRGINRFLNDNSII